MSMKYLHFSKIARIDFGTKATAVMYFSKGNTTHLIWTHELIIRGGQRLIETFLAVYRHIFKLSQFIGALLVSDGKPVVKGKCCKTGHPTSL